MPPAQTRVDTLITNAYIVLEASGAGADAQQQALAAGREIDGGWIALDAGRVHSAGPSTLPAPAAARVIDAQGRMVTPGLVNTHHHMYQNLTRAFAPAINGTLFEWLTTLYPRWAALDEESTYLSTYVACAELLLSGCTTSSDHMYVHPRPNLIDAQIKATTEIGSGSWRTAAR